MNDSTDFNSHGSAPYEPTDEEIAQMLASSPEERAGAEAMVLGACSGGWQKVARVVGTLQDEFERSFPHLPFVYLQATMEKLEDLGLVEITGDVWAMRYSEIRLSNSASGAL